MKRLVVLALVAWLVVVGVDSAAASVDTALAQQTAAAGPGQLVEAIVVLRSQADLSGARTGNRAQRLTDVVRTLRAHATHAQRGVVELLTARRAQGLVSSVIPLWVENAVAVRATPEVIRELAARPDVREVQPSVSVQAPPVRAAASTTSTTVEPNVTLAGAPTMWEQGFRGQGIVVANLDTGVDATHPDLAGAWRGGTNSWYDPNGQHPTTPTDVNGHGTQTMGVMVGGSGGGSAIGVAPDAKWIAAKIFNDRGSATSTTIHLGFQWLLDPDRNPATPDAPHVVNASWTTSGAACALDFQPDLRSLRAAGILPVFAAGNYGPSPGTVYSPANLPEAFAVGNTTNSDLLDVYSSRGPSACAGSVSPRLVAPGVGIHTTDLYGSYADDTGTSVAAPHVAGSLALLLSAFPQLSADRQQAALESSAVPLGAPGVDHDFGHGRLDVPAAYHWLATTPDFTLNASPSSATTPAGGAVSYSVSLTSVNGFADDVSLSLSGLSGSQASWQFAPSVVPGGSGTAQLTVTTTATIPPGTYPLTITGTSGSITRTATATLVVPQPPDFSLGATPSTRSVVAGNGTTYTVTVGALNGFTGTVTLSLAGLPGAVGTASYAPATVTTAGSSQLTINTSATAPAGSHSLTITGTSGAVTHTVTVTLVVTVQDFTLSMSPSSVTVNRGQTASYTVSVAGVGGFAASVTLSATGTPPGSSFTFTANPVGTPGTSTFRVRTTAQTTRGTFTLRITGTSGSRVHQSTATLTVR